MKEIGSVHEFSNGNFELIENVIVPEKEKKSFLIKLNLYTLLFIDYVSENSHFKNVENVVSGGWMKPLFFLLPF